jgi:arylsulfatase A
LRPVPYPDLPPFVNDQKMKLRRPALAAMLAYWAWLVVGYSTESNAVDRPNIIVILADDFGYGSTNAYGADKSLVQTPALDRLAAEGKRFTHAYTASSVCSPTRYALMTGRYAWRTSLQSGVLNPFAPLHIGTDQLNVASLLKKQQYKTAAVGKWHLGYGNGRSSDARTDYAAELKPGPLEIGFDYHFGVPSNHGDRTGVFVENRFVYGLQSSKVPTDVKIDGPGVDDPDFQATYKLNQNGTRQLGAIEIDAPRRKDERVMTVLTKKVVAWLDQQKKDEPFFLYYTPVAVHNPVTPSPELAGKSKAGPFGDWIHELDQSVDAVLKKLDEKGLTENTLVLFTSDNGGVNRPENKELIQTKAIEAGLAVNGSLHGGKHTVWEGGFRVPYIVRWPGKIRVGTVSEQVVSVADLLATTAAIVGETIPAAKEGAQDSYNVLPAYLDEELKEPVRRDVIVHSAAGVFAIRKGDWKWIEGVPDKEANAGVITNAGVEQNKPQLYNLKEDPAETKDVSEANPNIVSELKDLLERYRGGGYSRELPSIEESKSSPSGTGKVESLAFATPLSKVPTAPWTTPRGEWEVKDGALWGKSASQPAALRTPVSSKDLSIRYEVQLGDLQRQTVRVETTEPQRSFRLDITSTGIAIVKNAQGSDAQLELASADLKTEQGKWVPVEIQIAGDKAKLVVGTKSIETSHPWIDEAKSSATWVIAGGSAGLKNVVIDQK